MKTLPEDASGDQTGNIPQGYYRRNTGMLHMLQQSPPQSPASSLSADEIDRLDGMSREELIALIRRLYKPTNMILTLEAVRDMKALLLAGKKIDLSKYW